MNMLSASSFSSIQKSYLIREHNKDCCYRIITENKIRFASIKGDHFIKENVWLKYFLIFMFLLLLQYRFIKKATKFKIDAFKVKFTLLSYVFKIRLMKNKINLRFNT